MAEGGSDRSVKIICLKSVTSLTHKMFINLNILSTENYIDMNQRKLQYFSGN